MATIEQAKQAELFVELDPTSFSPEAQFVRNKGTRGVYHCRPHAWAEDRQYVAGSLATRTDADLRALGVLRLDNGSRYALIPVVGMGATKCGYTDQVPYEVVSVGPSGLWCDVRPLRAERDPEWKPEVHIGGFSAHVSNNHDQKWSLFCCPDAASVRIRLCKSGWQEKGLPFSVGVAVKFYDYNFVVVRVCHLAGISEWSRVSIHIWPKQEA